MGLLLSDQRLRAMYPGGRGDRVACRFARLWAAVFAHGLAPRRWVTLEVRGRRSGRTVHFPLGMADWQGHWYLVSMLGEHCHWVGNVRAAGRPGHPPAPRRRPLPTGRAAYGRTGAHHQALPGTGARGRPHIPVDRRAPLAEFEAVSSGIPVFRVVPLAEPRWLGRCPSSRPH